MQILPQKTLVEQTRNNGLDESFPVRILNEKAP